MAWYIYSSEALPNPSMLGKPGYTPDGSYIKTAGVALPFLPKDEWMELPESFTTRRRQDWRDKQGTEVEIPIKRFKPVVDANFASIGVVMLDHKPSEIEKQDLEKVSKELNYMHRKKAVEFYEDNRTIALARQGQYSTSPYVDECYELLGIVKPYSVDAMKAQRNPGAHAANQIAEAIAGAMDRDRKQTAEQLADIITRPAQEKPAARV